MKKINYLCFKCNNVAETEIKKLPNQFLENIEEKKEKIRFYFEMFNQERKKITWFKRFRKLLSLDMGFYYVKGNDFEMWLFSQYREIWKEQSYIKYNQDFTHYIKCAVCKNTRKAKWNGQKNN